MVLEVCNAHEALRNREHGLAAPVDRAFQGRARHLGCLRGVNVTQTSQSLLLELTARVVDARQRVEVEARGTLRKGTRCDGYL